MTQPATGGAGEVTVGADRAHAPSPSWLQRPGARVGLALAGALVLGAALRLPYLGYGLPGTPSVDSFRFVDDARAMLDATGDFRPADLIFPGLFKALLALLYGVLGLEGFASQHLAPRLVSTLFDLGTVALVFTLGRRLGGVRAGLLGAALHATSVITITSSRMESPDTTVTFFMTAALTLLTMPSLRLLHFVLGGVLIGCAAGTKYTGCYALILLALGAGLQLREGGRVVRTGGSAALGGGLAVVTFLATTPWFIPMFEECWGTIRVIAEVERYGQVGYVQASVLDLLVSSTPTWSQPWLASSVLYNLGPLVLLAGLAATVFALVGRLGRRPLVLAVYVVVFYVAITGRGHVKGIRYLMPVLPAVEVLIGCGAERLLQALGPARASLRRGGRVGLPLALLAFPLARTLPYLAASSKPVTNDLVFAWARDHLPPGSTVLLSPFYLDILRKLDLKVFTINGSGDTQFRTKSTLGVDTEEHPLYRPEILDSMRRSGLEYVVLGSYFEDALGDFEENRRWFPRTVAAYAAFRERLSREGDLLYGVRGLRDGRLGPDVLVYRLRPAAPGPEAPPP